MSRPWEYHLESELVKSKEGGILNSIFIWLLLDACWIARLAVLIHLISAE